MAVHENDSTAPSGDFTLGEWLVQPTQGRISRGETVVRLRPQLVDLLACLARGAGQTLTKREILERVWPKQFVAESGLARCVAELRQALGDAVQQPRYIETIPKRGYRLVAPVRWLPVDSLPSPATDAAVSPESDSGDQPHPTPRRHARAALILLLFAAGVVATSAAVRWLGWRTWTSAPATPAGAGERNRLVLVFENTTGETVFDEALPLALTVQLEQSPLLAVLPERRLRDELRFMGREEGARITRPLALEACQRAGAKAVLAGSIGRLGSDFVIGLDAVACESGESLARQQVEVDRRERILDGLGRAAAGIRERLGESLASIRQADVPPMQATTGSLEALKLASLADAERARGRDADAVRLYGQAIEIDPAFALARVRLGIHLLNLGRRAEGEEELQRAFALRDRVTTPERAYITGFYYSRVERDPFKAIETFEAWRSAYPHDGMPRMALSSLYQQVGRFDEALEEIRQVLRVDPHHSLVNAVMMECLMAMGRRDLARRVGAALAEREAANANAHEMLFVLAFQDGDREGMRRELEWSAAHPASANLFLDARATLEASGGRLEAAASLWRQLRLAAEQQGDRAQASETMLEEAESRALVGQRREAVALVARALRGTRSPRLTIAAAVVLGLAGDAAGADRLLSEYMRAGRAARGSDPEYRPVAQALIALQRGDARTAVDTLAPLRGYEAGLRFAFLPAFVRGLALERLRRPAEAAAEFERIAAGRGALPDGLINPVAGFHAARLRAAAGDAGAAARACRDALGAWKGADPGLPVLEQARRLCAAVPQ